MKRDTFAFLSRILSEVPFATITFDLPAETPLRVCLPVRVGAKPAYLIGSGEPVTGINAGVGMQAKRTPKLYTEQMAKANGYQGIAFTFDGESFVLA